MPKVHDQLEAVRVLLECHYRDMQDVEFTVERGKLYILQTRNGKRSPVAAFKIAVDQATKGLLSSAEAHRLVARKLLSPGWAAKAAKPILAKEEAIARIDAADIERLFYPVVDPSLAPEQLASQYVCEGIGAVPGAASGVVAFSAQDAEHRAAAGASVILVRKETSPEDVGGMHVASGILTATGGKTSHAAVVARGWGKCCIVGCDALNIDYVQQRALVNGRVIRAGEPITLDGSTGRVFEGRLPLVRPEPPPEYEVLMSWCDERRRMEVWANADTPADAAKAVELGAEGIGLCRTEHMFFDPTQTKRLVAMREMILAEGETARRAALDKLLPYQREDFVGIFTAMDGRPVTIRLIDPPLHEFLPTADNDEGLRSVTAALNASVREALANVKAWEWEARRRLETQYVSIEEVRARIDALHEVNPMLGHRGCRLCITYPEILEMQVRAVIEAAVQCEKDGVKVLPEIMIPLSIDPKELALLVEQTRAVADAILKEHKSKIKYLVGTMIETPRAAITAGRMAESAEFFSFGTNDLTQLTLGISRDDAGRFLPDYICERASQAGPILPFDPFQTLDSDGVGALIRVAVEKGRAARPKLILGICGEHGGDPASVRFCEELGLDYVSCSPPRVPIARLAAAQAAITLGRKPKTVRWVKANSKPKRNTATEKLRRRPPIERSIRAAKKASRRTVARGFVPVPV
jgi:pyruvate,orthophosphate dikinase